MKLLDYATSFLSEVPGILLRLLTSKALDLVRPETTPLVTIRRYHNGGLTMTTLLELLDVRWGDGLSSELNSQTGEKVLGVLTLRTVGLGVHCCCCHVIVLLYVLGD